MDKSSTEWMEFIDAEVRAACEAKGWGSQIRRKWSVRAKPVRESSLEDYEWKLIPGGDVRLPDLGPSQVDEGIYYVFSVDRRAKKLVLQHDTTRAGDMGPHFWHESFTAISFFGLAPGDADYWARLEQLSEKPRKRVPVPPRNGMLRDYLISLTSRFGPNHFSLT